MYYISNGKVFIKSGEVYRNVGFTAKNKVIVTDELDEVTRVMGEVTRESLTNAIEMTEKEVFAKFGLSENNPIEVIKTEVPKAKKSANKKK